MPEIRTYAWGRYDEAVATVGFLAELAKAERAKARRIVGSEPSRALAMLANAAFLERVMGRVVADVIPARLDAARNDEAESENRKARGA